MDEKEVAARALAIAGDHMIVRMPVLVWMRVILRVRVAVRMMDPSVLSYIAQRSSCRFRYAKCD